MRDQSAALAAIDRVGAISWRQDPARLGSQVALMKEYLRRSALAAETLGGTADWPWYDAAARLTLPDVETRYQPGYYFLEPETTYRGPDTDPLELKIIDLYNRMNKIPGVKSAYAWQSCLWYVRWAAIKNHPALASLNLPDPYEPLIAFHERGGWFKPEQGYLDLGGANVTRTGWRQAAQQPPLPSLDSQFLDQLDREQREAERRTP